MIIIIKSFVPQSTIFVQFFQSEILRIEHPSQLLPSINLFLHSDMYSCFAKAIINKVVNHQSVLLNYFFLLHKCGEDRANNVK